MGFFSTSAFDVEVIYNDSGYSSRITHIPTGLSEQREDIDYKRSPRETQLELSFAIRQRLIEILGLDDAGLSVQRFHERDISNVTIVVSHSNTNIFVRSDEENCTTAIGLVDLLIERVWHASEHGTQTERS